MSARIVTPRQLLIGGGAVKELVTVLQGLGLGRPLVVTDPHLIEIGKLDIVAGLLDGAGIPWQAFSEIREEGYEWRGETVIGETVRTNWTSSCRRRSVG